MRKEKREKDMAEEYKDLMDAHAIIAKARYQITVEYGVDSPAWSKLYRVSMYLAKQADKVLNEVLI